MLTKYYIENKKKLALICAGYLSFCIVVGCWAGFFANGGGEGELMSYIVLVSLFMAVMASLMFNDLKTKEGRINALMAPASTAQKFWPRFLVVLPGSLILCIVGFYALEGARILITGLSYDLWTPFYNPWKLLCWSDKAEVWGYTFLLAGSLFSLSCYIFGAILWPRYSFLKTMAALFVVQSLLSTVGVFILRHFIYIHVNLEAFDIYAKIFVFLMLAGAVAFVWLTYRRFKHCTLTQNVFSK